MTTGLQGLFERFAADPSPEHFRALRAQLVGEPTYNPLADDVEAAARLLADGDAARAWETLVPAMANYLLSPRAHRVLAAAAERLGEAGESRRRSDLAAACLRGILATGDGTAERPYLVTRVSDEYDVLERLEKRCLRQSLQHHDGRACDVLELEGGGEMWFDITVAFDRMGGMSGA